MIVIKQVELIKRLDQLIRLQATGTPDKLADRLQISKPTLYRTLNMMKDFGAPIEYDPSLSSFVYIKNVDFKFGFYRDHKNKKQLHAKHVTAFSTIAK
ncbi:HTH domain-containing protein [Aquimarina algicola]|uniref:HTH domain-containing protein n=1 Tax=Aquimarina algicola TaxID=2589995 RepID=A0A504JKU4_9FLAO|nr:HTH domain-containing protein [Aquimarina algicola]TPN87379.1 HTH domain-containing protein [Aquimarina algicola]